MKDPLDKGPATYSRFQVERYFGPRSDARLAQQLKKENPGAYAEMKNLAVNVYELIDQRTVELRRKPTGPTPEQADAMEQFSKEECDRYFKGIGQPEGSKDNLANLAKNDPAKAAILKLAAQGHGTLDIAAPVTVRDFSPKAQRRARQHEQEREAIQLDDSEGAHRFQLHPDLARLAGVEAGTLVTADDLGAIAWAIRQNAQSVQQQPAHDPEQDPNGTEKVA